jgi:hypothetical protein
MQGRRRHPCRAEDPLAQEFAVTLAACALDDKPEQEIALIAVLELRARRCVDGRARRRFQHLRR